MIEETTCCPVFAFSAPDGALVPLCFPHPAPVCVHCAPFVRGCKTAETWPTSSSPLLQPSPQSSSRSVTKQPQFLTPTKTAVAGERRHSLTVSERMDERIPRMVVRYTSFIRSYSIIIIIIIMLSSLLFLPRLLLVPWLALFRSGRRFGFVGCRWRSPMWAPGTYQQQQQKRWLQV